MSDALPTADKIDLPGLPLDEEREIILRHDAVCSLGCCDHLKDRHADLT